MRALTADPGSGSGLRISEVPDPDPSPDQALLRVIASCVNRGERTRLATASAGHVFGWDVVAVVERNALIGPSFAIGSVVVGLAGAGGGWAEHVAMRATDLAPLPTGLDPCVAATLPVAGLTALRAVRLGPQLLGARVLVIGSGAVAGFAVQFALLAGAGVAVSARNAEAMRGLAALGATPIDPADLAAVGGFDLVVDTVGGSATPGALRAARAFGRVVVVGNVGESGAGINSGALLASGAVLQGYRLVVDAESAPLGSDMEQLLSWVSSGAITPPENRQIDWSDEAAVEAATSQGFGQVRAVLRIATP